MGNNIYKLFAKIFFLFSLVIFNNIYALNGWSDSLLGEAKKSTSVYAGMWSFHPEVLTEDHDYNDNNKLLGLLYNGYYASRLKNSYNDTCYALGIQRSWYSNKIVDDLDFNFGYRFGAIYGYKKGTTPAAKYTKVIPLPGLMTNFSYNHVGVEFAMNAYVLSTSFFMSF